MPEVRSKVKPDLLLPEAFKLEQTFSTLPFAWAKTTAEQMKLQREAYVHQALGQNLSMQADNLINLGYPKILNNLDERPEHQLTNEQYKDNVVVQAMGNIDVNEVIERAEQGFEPILIDARYGAREAEDVAKIYNIGTDEIKKGHGMQVIGGRSTIRGRAYLSANRDSDVYIAWMKPGNLPQQSRKAKTIIQVEDGLPGDERGSNFVETASYLREHPEMIKKGLGLHVLGHLFHSDLKKHKHEEVDDFYVPIFISQGEGVNMVAIEQSSVSPGGVYLSTKYNEKDIQFFGDNIQFPRYQEFGF